RVPSLPSYDDQLASLPDSKLSEMTWPLAIGTDPSMTDRTRGATWVRTERGRHRRRAFSASMGNTRSRASALGNSRFLNSNWSGAMRLRVRDDLPAYGVIWFRLVFIVSCGSE